MKTRVSSYEDYQISPQEKDDLLKKCRYGDEKTELQLLLAAQDSCEEIAADLFLSIRRNVSFERLEMAGAITNYGKGDFYGYRRKALFLFKERLERVDDDKIAEIQKKGYSGRYKSLQELSDELRITRGTVRQMARNAGAVVKFGALYRIDMEKLYQYYNGGQSAC